MWQGLWEPPLHPSHLESTTSQSLRMRDAVLGSTHTSQSWRCQDVRKTNLPATMDSVWGWVKDATSWLTAKMSLMKKVATSWRYWMGTTRRLDHTFWMTLLMCQFQFKLVDINEADYSIEISLLWKDKRVTFHSLKLSHSLNVLSEDSSHMKTSKNCGPNRGSKQQTNNKKFNWQNWQPNNKQD